MSSNTELERALRLFQKNPAIFLEQTEAGKELKQQLTEDPKSGLLNHRGFMKEAEIEVERAKRSELPLCVIYLDIDHFKQINDTFGHAEGDDAIRRLSQSIRKNIRITDKAGRVGDKSDEFVIILPETQADIAQEIAERIQQEIPPEKFPISFSYGVCIQWLSEDSKVTVKELIEHADREMYKHKFPKRPAWELLPA